MADVIVPSEKHEAADHKLAQAQGVAALMMASEQGHHITESAWAIQGLIEDARELIGKC